MPKFVKGRTRGAERGLYSRWQSKRTNSAIAEDRDRIRATSVPEAGAADPKAPSCGCACHETSEPLPAAADCRTAQPPWLPETDRSAQQWCRDLPQEKFQKGFSALNGLELRLHASSFLKAPTYSRPVVAGAGFVTGTATTGRLRSTGSFCGRHRCTRPTKASCHGACRPW
jgi:hypothetical protein